MKILNVFCNKEFILFLLIGGFNTLSGVVFSLIYSYMFNANVSFVLGYITGLFISYVLNSCITFKERLHFIKFLKFTISYIPNFIIQNIVVFLTYNVLEINKVIAYCVAACIGIPVTFIFMKYFTFQKE